MVMGRLAREILRGFNSVEGVEGKLWQVPETLSAQELTRLRAPPKSDEPIIPTIKLVEADGLVFGFPSRFAMMAAQFKALLDTAQILWKPQFLLRKLAGIFYGTSSQGGGQETTPLTAITQLVHLGMLYVPIGYTFGPAMFEMNEQNGTGAYAGDGSRQPTVLELGQAFHQGKYIATIAKKL